MVTAGRSPVAIRLFLITGLGNVDLGADIVNNVLHFLCKGLSVSSGRVIHGLGRFKPHAWVKSIIREEG